MIEIEKGVPFPRRYTDNLTEVLFKMEVADSISIPFNDGNSKIQYGVINNRILYHKKRNPEFKDRKFTVRKMDNHFRVWRKK